MTFGATLRELRQAKKLTQGKENTMKLVRFETAKRQDGKWKHLPVIISAKDSAMAIAQCGFAYGPGEYGVRPELFLGNYVTGIAEVTR